MKKAQGLPFNTIVLAIIAVLVLVLVVLFASGTLSKLFGQAKTLSEASEADISAARITCSQLCVQAQNIKSDLGWSVSAYCTKKFAKLNNTLCWRDPVREFCTVKIGDKECSASNPADAACGACA